MNINLSKYKVILLVCQGLVLLSVVLAGVLVLGTISVKNLSAVWLEEIDRTAHFLSNQLQQGKPFVGEGTAAAGAVSSVNGELSVEEYIFLVRDQRINPGGEVEDGSSNDFQEDLRKQINKTHGYRMFIFKEDGSPVVPRKAQGSSDAERWEQHRTKLVYEMRKQKRGWIYYPEKESWQIDERSQVIRYLLVEKMGWIVALEGEKASELDLFLGIFNKNSILYFLLSLSLGVLVVLVVSNKIFNKIEKTIENIRERNYIEMNNVDTNADNSVDKEKDAKKHNHFKETLAVELEKMKKALPPEPEERVEELQEQETHIEEKILFQQEVCEERQNKGIEQYFLNIIGDRRAQIFNESEKQEHTDKSTTAGEIKSELLRRLMKEVKTG